MLKPDHREKHPTEAEIDEALKESFPASDPPAWNLGIEQPCPHEEKEPEGKEDASDSKARSKNSAG
ncbi:MAG TPA: hypothetical protein VF131_13860 [Blastocatellia bacterium]|nr:hypothetical protein [Blastocatellia bacterium]